MADFPDSMRRILHPARRSTTCTFRGQATERGSRKAALPLLALAHFALAAAQTEPSDAVRRELAAARDAIAQAFDCEVTVLGEPRRPSVGDGWYASYMASGPECDAAAAELQRRAAPLGLTYSRRPDRAQLRTLLRPMLRAAQTASGCRLSLQGQPRVDEASGDWFVRYRSAGSNCAEAADELRRQGRALDVTFLESTPPGLIRDVR